MSRLIVGIGVAIFVILGGVVAFVIFGGVATNGSAVEKTREYKAMVVRVKNSSAIMSQHKNYYMINTSGPVGREGIPEVITVGDKITVKGSSLVANHIFVTEVLEDLEWAGEVLALKGDIACTIVERLQDLPYVDEGQERDRLWIYVKECEPQEKISQ